MVYLGLKKLISNYPTTKRNTGYLWPVFKMSNKQKMIGTLSCKLYEAEKDEPICFDDGSVISHDLLAQILDALTEK